MLKQVFPVRMDVRKADDVATAVDKSISEFGLPDLVLNNAAGNFISPTERLSPNAFATIIGIVLQGTANVTLDIGKRLIKEKKGDDLQQVWKLLKKKKGALTSFLQENVV